MYLENKNHKIARPSMKQSTIANDQLYRNFNATKMLLEDYE
jgi:hypothetical protein